MTIFIGKFYLIKLKITSFGLNNIEYRRDQPSGRLTYFNLIKKTILKNNNKNN